jgi:hypothetical protein
MLNKCFKDALEMREQWPELVNWEPYFESQIEESNPYNTNRSSNPKELLRPASINSS